MGRSTARAVALASLAAIAAGATAAALAATPASGTVSNGGDPVSWTGTLLEGAASYNAFNNNPDAPCAPPSCDTFALTVADAGDLTLTAELGRTGSSGAADAGFRITAPDGATTFSGGPSEPGKPFKLVVKKAVKGDYTVDIVDSFVGTPGEYTATAQIGAPKPAAQPAPSATPGPAPASTPPPGSGQSQPGTTLAITTKSASAKKVGKARKLAVGLSASAPVSDVTVTLLKGSKKVASGKLASLASKGKVTLKVGKKLKPGGYRLTASGTDGQGRPVSAGSALKVKR